MYPQAREIGIFLVLKVTALMVIFFLFFVPSDRPRVDSGRLADQILATEQK